MNKRKKYIITSPVFWGKLILDHLTLKWSVKYDKLPLAPPVHVPFSCFQRHNSKSSFLKEERLLAGIGILGSLHNLKCHNNSMSRPGE
jgi:hypothetical protein